MDRLSVLRKIDGLMENDFEDAKGLLDEISSLPEFLEYKDMIEYLYGVVKEKEAFLSLDEATRNEYLSIKNNAKNLYKRFKNEEALEEYRKAKEVSGLAICDYYIGKVLFKLKRYDEARKALLCYLSQRGIKTEKAFMYLGSVERIYKNMTLYEGYIGKMNRIHRVFNRNYKYVPNRGKKKKKRYNGHGGVGVSRHTTMPQNFGFEDRGQDTPLSVESFYEVGLDEKLLIIRNLLQTGNEVVANKLFSEVQRECAPEERGKVMQFERNRRIYKNQRRTTS